MLSFDHHLIGYFELFTFFTIYVIVFWFFWYDDADKWY